MLNDYIINIWSPLTVFLCFCLFISLIKHSLTKDSLKTWELGGKDQSILLHFSNKSQDSNPDKLFFKISLMWTIFKVFIQLVTILLLFFYILVFWPQSMWNLSSPIRD